jgi:regulator of sigma E protease
MDILLNALNSGFNTIVPFVVLLGILIFVHELGHFMVARWCGVRVEVFSLGFGKKILTHKKGDTVYALSLIPLGGYVKMFGEQNGDNLTDDEKKVAFTHKTVWQRIAIVLAGPIMNFLFAILVFFVVATIGEEAKTPVLGDVPQASQAYQAGFRSGDKVTQVNGAPIKTWEDIQQALSLKESQELSLNFDVVRADGSTTEKVSLTAQAQPNPNVLSSYDYLATIEGFTHYSAGTTVGVTDTSPLKALGLQTGDTITSVNGQAVTYWRDLAPKMASLNPQENLTLEVSGVRDDEKASKPMTITMAANSGVKSYSLEGLGLESAEFYLYSVIKDSPAEAAGLLKNDRIVAINNKKITKWEDVITNIKSYDGKNAVDVLVLRDGKSAPLKITPKMTKQMTAGGAEEKRYTIGIAPFVNLAMPEMMSVKHSNPAAAIARGAEKTWDVTVMTVMSFVRLFQGSISPKNIGGVISIGQAASETFKMGINQYLQMMAIISVNLFILNLLPIPVLDGGHLVFYIVEVVKGAPLSMKKMEVAQQVGLALLMSLMIFALFNDFTRLFGR